MNNEKRPYVCPAELAGSLDNSLRRLVHKPSKILGPRIKNGMKVLDLGCGPGYFSVVIAEMTGDTGRVIAADLQEGMLEKVYKKIRGTHLEQRIELHKCQEDKIGISEKVDFILAFWMIHEVPDQERMFMEMKSILKPGGKIFIAEPKFHVTKKAFNEMITRLEMAGFTISEWPKVFVSRAIIVS
jgi:ubiquinone/menaquinone biosynthesis C-methylase UbiE